MSARLLTTFKIFRGAGALSRQAHGGGHKKFTMNDLPVPQGDWQEAYHTRNKKYNMILIAGAFMFLASIAIVKSTGIIHFNYSPPRSYD